MVIDGAPVVVVTAAGVEADATTSDVAGGSASSPGAELHAAVRAKTATQSLTAVFTTCLSGCIIGSPTVPTERRGVPSRAVTGQVHIRRNGAIGTIALDHPERRNAISADMWRGLLDAAHELGDDDNIRAVVIRGEGEKAFAAGADISQFGAQRSSSDANASYDDVTGQAYLALANMSKPLIAAIHGFCIGGGLAVALTADIRIAADDAQFTIPAARLGLGYGAGGIGNLIRLVGPSAAKRIMFMADRFGPDEALNMGLINKSVPKADLDATVDEWAETIAGNAPLTIAAVKATVAEWVKDESRRDFTTVEAMVKACFDSEDYKEGVDAFMNKRSAQFTGR
jgi:enoyl-CoA hydratase